MITNPEFIDVHNRILRLLFGYYDKHPLTFPTTTQLFEYVVTNGIPAAGFNDILFVLRIDNRFRKYVDVPDGPDPLQPGTIWIRVPRVPTFTEKFKL